MQKRFFGILLSILVAAIIALTSATPAQAKTRHRHAAKHHQPAKEVTLKLVKTCIGKLLFVFIARDFAHGDPREYVRLAKAYDIDAIAIKTYDVNQRRYTRDRRGRIIGVSWPDWMPYRDGTDVREFTRQLARALHQARKRCYSWSFTYAGRPPYKHLWQIRNWSEVRYALLEAGYTIDSIQLGVDGHIFNPEIESKGHYRGAKVLVQTVRRWINRTCPEKLLAWCPLDNPDVHPTIPWDEFQEGCDIMMPQTYAFNRPPAERLLWAYKSWLKLEAYYRSKHRADLIKPIMPVSQCYRATANTECTSPKSIVDFAWFVRGYYTGVAFYEGGHAGPAQLDAVRRSFGNYRQKLPYYYKWQARVKRLGILEASKPTPEPPATAHKAAPHHTATSKRHPGAHRPTYHRPVAKRRPAAHKPKPVVRKPAPKPLTDAQWAKVMMAKVRVMRRRIPADQALRGLTVWLDPGHSVGEPGRMLRFPGSTRGTAESDIVRDVAVRLAKCLQRRGAQVKWTVRNQHDLHNARTLYWRPSRPPKPLKDCKLLGMGRAQYATDHTTYQARRWHTVFLSFHMERRGDLVVWTVPNAQRMLADAIWTATKPLGRSLRLEADEPPQVGVLFPDRNGIVERAVIDGFPAGDPREPLVRERLAQAIYRGLVRYWHQVP